jgi:hypothetical protein
MAILTFFLSPVGRLLGIGLLVVALIAGIDIHARVSQFRADQARIEREAATAVSKANEARKAAVNKFDNGGDSDRPSVVPGRVRHGTDGFARD